MQRTKSSSQTRISTLRPISITSNVKFQRFQKLNSLVNQIHGTKIQSGDQQKQSGALNPRQISSNTSEKVLQMLKTRIKTNYDNLYSNYQDNKHKILKQIQTVQTNIAGQNALNNKIDDSIKQKAKLDKLKTIVDQKQRKLKKLCDMKEQFKLETNTDADKSQEWSETLAKINSFQQKKQEIQHQTLILNQMLRQRKQIYLNLKKRHNNMLQDLTHKNERGQKLSGENLKKKSLLDKIYEQLQRQDEVKIPPKLAEELSTKIEMYENKHSYNNIIGHEAILSDQRYRQFKEDTNKERQQQKNNKIKRDNQEKNQLQQLYNIFLIKNIEQQKIKRLCGVQNVQEIIGSNLNLDKANLQKISNQVNRQIQHYQQQNKKLQGQLENMIVLESKIDKIDSIDELLKIQEQLQKDKNLIKNQLTKKLDFANQCQIIMQFISPQQTKQSFTDFINTIEKKYSEKANYIGQNVQSNERQAKFTKIPMVERQESQQFQ